MKIMKLFSEEEVSKILQSLEKCKWSDGKNSALGFAKEIKNNTQIFPDQKAFKPILDMVNLKLGGDAFKSEVRRIYGDCKRRSRRDGCLSDGGYS